MASSEDLKTGKVAYGQFYIIIIIVLNITVLKDALQNRGVLGEMKAKLRAEVYRALDDNVCLNDVYTYVCVCVLTHL